MTCLIGSVELEQLQQKLTRVHEEKCLIILAMKRQGVYRNGVRREKSLLCDPRSESLGGKEKNRAKIVTWMKNKKVS